MIEFFGGTNTKNSIIGWHNVVESAVITGTTGATGYPLSSLASYATYDRYQPSTYPAEIEIDAGAPVAISYAGFAVHTLSGFDIDVEYSADGVFYSLAATSTALNNDELILVFAETTARYWRITISGTGVAEIGVLYLGKVLEMQRPAVHRGNNPLRLSRVTAVRPNVSETGNFLGAKQYRKGLKGSFEWNNLKNDWYRTNFDPFVANNPRSTPFLMAWHPELYPNDVSFCWATGDISPTYQHRNYLGVSLDVEAYDGR